MPTATRQPTQTSELIAREALALRATLIRVYRSSASREDLEDLYSQAVIELLARAQRDPTLTSPGHIRHALRQKFDSRILDHHRAVAGRSPATHARARTRPLDDALDQRSDGALGRVPVCEITPGDDRDCQIRPADGRLDVLATKRHASVWFCDLYGALGPFGELERVRARRREDPAHEWLSPGLCCG